MELLTVPRALSRIHRITKPVMPRFRGVASKIPGLSAQFLGQFPRLFLA